LLPPKPKELLRARRTLPRRDSPGIERDRRVEIFVFGLPGSRSCVSASAQMTASTAPAAPSVWPVAPLVELQGTRLPNSAADRLAFGGVIGRRRGAVQVDVVDVDRAQTGRAQRSRHRHPGAEAFRVRRRHVVGIARFAGAEQQSCRLAVASGSAFEQREGGALADRNAVARTS
jgi:hypothetical protein